VGTFEGRLPKVPWPARRGFRGARANLELSRRPSRHSLRRNEYHDPRISRIKSSTKIPRPSCGLRLRGCSRRFVLIVAVRGGRHPKGTFPARTLLYALPPSETVCPCGLAVYVWRQHSNKASTVWYLSRSCQDRAWPSSLRQFPWEMYFWVYKASPPATASHSCVCEVSKSPVAWRKDRQRFNRPEDQSEQRGTGHPGEGCCRRRLKPKTTATAFQSNFFEFSLQGHSFGRIDSALGSLDCESGSS